MKRIPEVQALRFVAALLVVGAHIIPGFAPVGSHGVDIFFVISGFVMVWSSEKSFGRSETIGPFLWNRITRIVPLYWLMTFIIISYAPGNYPLGKIVTSLFFIPSNWPSTEYPLFPALTIGWTLNIEMFFYAVFAFFLRFERRIAVQCVCLILCALVSIGGLLPLSPAVAFYYASPKLIEFAMGCLLANICIEKSYFPSLLRRDSPAAKLANVLGDSSYALYLTHAYVAFVIDRGPLIGCIGAVAVSIAVYFLVERPSTLALRWLGLRLFSRSTPISDHDSDAITTIGSAPTAAMMASASGSSAFKSG